MIADTFSQRFLGEQPGQVASISLLKKKKKKSSLVFPFRFGDYLPSFTNSNVISH